MGYRGDTGKCREIRVEYKEMGKTYRMIRDLEWTMQWHLRKILGKI
jgi:hypothetical protein